MNVYTYFFPTCPEGQADRIRLWERSVRAHGHTPKILTRRVAEKNKMFKRLSSQGVMIAPVWMFALLEVGGGCMDDPKMKFSKASLVRLIKTHASRPTRATAR